MSATLQIDRFSQSKILPSWFAVILHLAFGTLFIFVGSVLLVMGGLQPIGLWCLSLNWVETACTIDSAKIVRDEKAKGVAYLPDLSYRYLWNGESHQGTRLSWDSASYRNRESVEKWIEPFQVGQPAICYVNPNRPQDAVLSRAIPKPPLFAIPATMLFIAIGLHVFFGGLRELSTPKSSSS
jgi:hypothetical protein